MGLVRVQTIKRYSITESEIDPNTGYPFDDDETTGDDTVIGNIQPVTGSKLEILQKGKIEISFWNFYTETHVLQRSDKLEHKGRLLKMIWSADWDNPSSTIPHRHYILQDEGKIPC